MSELKCIFINASPFGPQDESGIGKNTRINFIPLDKELMLESDKYIGYSVSKYNEIWDNSQKSWFDYIKKEKLILIPVLISYTMDLSRHCTITNIKKI